MSTPATVTIKTWLRAQYSGGYNFADKILFFEGKRVKSISSSHSTDEAEINLLDGSIVTGIPVLARLELQDNPMLAEPQE